MKLSTILIGTAIVCASFVGAYAQDKTPVVDQREKNQDKRIDQGIKSGEVTGGEAARLEAQQGKIKVDEAKAKSDGVVTAKERAKLKAAPSIVRSTTIESRSRNIDCRVTQGEVSKRCFTFLFHRFTLENADASQMADYADGEVVF